MVIIQTHSTLKLKMLDVARSHHDDISETLKYKLEDVKERFIRNPRELKLLCRQDKGFR